MITSFIREFNGETSVMLRSNLPNAINHSHLHCDFFLTGEGESRGHRLVPVPRRGRDLGPSGPEGPQTAHSEFLPIRVKRRVRSQGMRAVECCAVRYSAGRVVDSLDDYSTSYHGVLQSVLLPLSLFLFIL